MAGAGAGAKIRGKGGVGTLEKEVKFFTLKFCNKDQNVTGGCVTPTFDVAGTL